MSVGCRQSRCFEYMDPRKATVFEFISNGDGFYMLRHPSGYCLTASRHVSLFIDISLLFSILSSQLFLFIFSHSKQLNKEQISVQGYECTANNDNLWHTNGELIRNKDGRALW